MRGLIWILLGIWLITGCKDKIGQDLDYSLYPPLGAAFSATSGEVTFFDLRTNEIVVVERMDGWSVSAEFALTGSHLFVTENRNNRISLYSLPDFSLVDQIEFGAVPVDLTVNRQASLVYVVSGNANFRRISLADGEVDTVGVGLNPRRLALRPINEVEMWIACRDDSSVYIVDLFSFTVSGTIRYPASPTDIRFTQDGAIAYVSLAGGQGIRIHDADSGDSLGTLAAGQGSFDIDLSSDGLRLAASDSTSGFVRIWDLSAGEYWDLRIGEHAGRARFTQDGNSLYVMSMTENYVLRIDLTGEDPVVADTISVAPTLREIALWERLP